jgi:hypothetical protein
MSAVKAILVNLSSFMTQKQERATQQNQNKSTSSQIANLIMDATIYLQSESSLWMFTSFLHFPNLEAVIQQESMEGQLAEMWTQIQNNAAVMKESYG